MPLSLGTGEVIRADSVKKLYKISLSERPFSTVMAVPVNGLPTIPGTNGVVSCTSYAIGDHVLFVYTPVTAQDYTPIAWILGRVPKDVVYTDTRKQEDKWTLYPPELLSLTSGIYQLINSTLQDSEFLSDYNAAGYFPSDVNPGDHSLSGLHTYFNVNDYNISLTAGKSSILVDSVIGAIKQSSTLYDRFTIGESLRTQSYRGHIIHTRRLGSDLATGIMAGGSKLFPYREQFSDLIYGSRSEILSSKGAPISQISQDLDGSVNIRAANTVSIHRTVYIPNYFPEIDDSLTLGEPLPEQSKDKPLAAISGDTYWKAESLIDGTDTIFTQILDSVGEDEWEAKKSTNTVEYNNSCVKEAYKVLRGESGLDILPDGTVIIRDAWGSELRMGGGNIQISAANNLTNVVGRDKLDIVSGVSTVSAGDGIELGAATGDISIGTKGTLRVSGNDLNVHANNMTEYVEVEKKSKLRSEYKEAQKSETRITGYGSIVAARLQLTGENSFSLTSNACGLTLSSNSIIMGASVVDVHGNLRLNKGKYVIKDVTRVDYSTRDISTPVTDASLVIGGTLAVDGVIISNDNIQTSKGVYADTMAAHDVTAIGGIYKLRNAPKKRNNLNIKDDFEYSVGSDKKELTRLRELFTDTLLADLRKVFRLSSKAFKIIQPLFSLVRGRKNVSPATCSGNGSEVSYIYPGKNFWETDGLVTMSTTPTDMSKEPEIQVSGCNQLRLNSTNVIKEK